MTTEAETEEMRPQAKECLGPPEDEEAGPAAPWSLQRERGPDHT